MACLLRKPSLLSILDRIQYRTCIYLCRRKYPTLTSTSLSNKAMQQEEVAYRINLRFKYQRVMKQPFSLNIVKDQAEPDLNNLASVPPGCDKMGILGLLTIRLQIQYLSKTNSNLIFRAKLWGSEHENLHFRNLEDSKAVLNLNIRSSIEKLSKYCNDMGVICIECFIPGIDKHNQREFKTYGWIFLNIKRYIINFVLNDFEQTVSIVDQRKNKLGEVIAQLSIQMYKKERIHQNVTQTEIIHHRNSSANYANQPQEYEAVIREGKHERKNSADRVSQFSKKEAGKRNTIDDILLKQVDAEEFVQRQNVPTKGKAKIFLQEYMKNKPEHSEMSMIREKYGLNCPSIQVMKLKLDQAFLLSKHERQASQQSKNVHILLKCIKNDSKSKIDSLVIACQQHPSFLKTETKIALGDQVGNKIEINYLYVFPNAQEGDRLSFEAKQARAEVSIEELKHRTTVELRGKNGKRCAIIQFSLISDKFVANPTQRQVAYKQKEHNIDFIKQNCFVKIEGWELGKIQLKNNKIGTIYGSKLIFQAEKEEHLLLQVQLEASNGQRHTIQLALHHLFKQENYVLSGKQVKIITARGKINDLLELASKMETKADPHAEEQAPKEQQTKQVFDLKQLSTILGNLQKCQSQECNELMQSLSKVITQIQLNKLSNLIDTNPQTFSLILKQAFNNDFSRFFKSFLTYHNWNHRYQISQKKVQKIIQNSHFCSQLQKAVKRLKRSSEVLFGMIPSSSLYSEFLKYDEERPMTQQTQSQFNRQQLVKLLILLLQRYSVKCIKITQLQAFVSNQPVSFLLNSYLISKMAHECISNIQLFRDCINQGNWELIDLFRKEMEEDWGLAKLLLVNDVDLASSSIASQLQRKETEHIPTVEEEHNAILKTESEENIEIRQETKDHVVTENQERQKITIVINSVTLDGVQGVEGAEEIEITSEHLRIRISQEDAYFPKAIELADGVTYTVKISTIGSSYVGVFIATSRPQKVALFSNGVESGKIYLFSPKLVQNDEEEIAIRIVQTQANHVIEDHHQPQQKRQELQVKSIIPVAKSPFVRLTIRSIRPTRSNYKLILQSQHQRKAINFPNENEILLKNCQGWRVRLVDQHLDNIFVSNQLTSSPFCFVDSRDQRVIFTAVIEVQELWEQQLLLGLKESIQIIIHFDLILAVKPLEQSDYSLVIGNDSQEPTLPFHIASPSENIKVDKSLHLSKPLQRIQVKLFSKYSKELLAEFQFTLKIIQKGIAKNSRYLLSKSKGYRLKTTIFQIRHSWQYCKPDRILTLFSSQNRKTVESWLRFTCDISEEQLIAWLRANFQLTLTEITIILEELLNRKEREGAVEGFIEVFQSDRKINLPYIKDIKEEFSVFDYSDDGVVTQDQLKIAKKVFARNLKDFSELLVERQADFVPTPQLKENFIIDLSPAIRSNFFDYLSFLDLIEQNPQKQQEVIQANKKKEKLPQIKGQNLSIKIIQFNNLSLNKLPCTLLFKVNDQILAQPIHKCYSHKYVSSNEIIVPRVPQPNLHIFLQTLRSTGVWDCKLLQTVVMNQHIKIFGGSVRFSIEPTDRQKAFNSQEIDENIDSNQREVLQTPKSQEEKKPKIQLGKSFWNKSLRQTQQKWANSRRQQKQRKRQPSDDDDF